MSDWHRDAQRLHDEGILISEIAKRVGHSTSMVRWALDIDGAREKHRDRVQARRRRNSLQYLQVRPKVKSFRQLAEQPSAQGFNAERSEPRRPSLPNISLPLIEETAIQPVRPTSRAAPAAVSNGADRIREIHRAMIRAGKIQPPSDLLADLHL